MRSKIGILSILAAAGALIPCPAQAQLDVAYQNFALEMDAQSTLSRQPVPPSLSDLRRIPKENTIVEEQSGLPFDIRDEAQREAAISYGARGGLAYRTYQIRQEIEMRSAYLDKVYNFAELLIPAPSGLLIEPPIISEVENAMLITSGGQEAAVSDRIYNIMEDARIVSSPRTWRTYLEREWGEVDPPPDILRPANKDERKQWIKLVNRGWSEGIEQANEIFEEDLNRLNANFQGMVRFRMLLAQGMVSAPYSLQTERGVTGGGSEMKVGDRAIQITGKPSLNTGFEKWQPVNR